MRQFLLGLISLAFGGIAQAATPKNVVVIIADDLGFQIGCYGDQQAKTPHLDALAARSTKFTHAFASVASCSSSRATILTGLPTHQCGQYGLHHATHNVQTFKTVKSLPSLLKPSGYYNAVIAKLHVGPSEVYPFDALVPAGNNRDPVVFGQRFTETLIKAGDKPFFIQVGFVDPHRAAQGFGNHLKFHPDTPAYRPNASEIQLPYFLPDQPEVRAEMVEFYQAVTRLDDAVGRIMKALEQAGKAENTLIMFVSDNGIPFPGAKTTVYDSGLQLPLLIYQPGVKPAVNHSLVSFTDFAPTILAWAGVSKPTEMLGENLLPLLGNEAELNREAIYASHQFHEITMYYPMRMIRTKSYKLIANLAHHLEYPSASDLWNSPTWQGVLTRNDDRLGLRSVKNFLNRPHYELYDLTKDPNELQNLALDTNHQTVFEELRSKLIAWQKETNDPWMIKEKHE